MTIRLKWRYNSEMSSHHIIVVHKSEIILSQMEASEPKWVNPVLNIVGVNSFRLGGLQMFSRFLYGNHFILWHVISSYFVIYNFIYMHNFIEDFWYLVSSNYLMFTVSTDIHFMIHS